MAITNKLKAIADAIRLKRDIVTEMTLEDMPLQISLIEGGGSSDVPFPFGGLNATLISEYSETYTLDDTTFVRGESASTTATSIKATVSNRYTNTTGSPTINYGDKDIVVVQTVKVTPTHSADAVDKARQIKGMAVTIAWFSKRKTTDTSAKTTRNVLGTTSMFFNKYYNASGTITRATSTAYGIYAVPQAPNIASTTSASTYVRINSPTLNYRVSSSYESADNIKKVTDCVWEWDAKVYSVDPFTSPLAQIHDIVEPFLIN